MRSYENEAQRQGFRFIVGIDEAGRGPLAGPVVAGAVYVREYRFKSRIDDSKQMSPQERLNAYHEIFEKACVGIGIMNETVIDEANILRATHMAMARAVRQLINKLPSEIREQESFQEDVCLLIDGNSFCSDLPYLSKTVIGGDAKVFSIACASIVAKVYRDRILEMYDRIFPGYWFAQHKGYPTGLHRKLLEEFGPSPIHRKTFQSVADILDDEQ